MTEAVGASTEPDPNGNMIEQITPEGTLHYVYNNLDQHTETWTDPATNPATNPANVATSNASAITDTVYGYDSLGRLNQVQVTRTNQGQTRGQTRDRHRFPFSGSPRWKFKGG
jgi:hypothetical protein